MNNYQPPSAADDTGIDSIPDDLTDATMTEGQLTPKSTALDAEEDGNATVADLMSTDLSQCHSLILSRMEKPDGALMQQIGAKFGELTMLVRNTASAQNKAGTEDTRSALPSLEQSSARFDKTTNGLWGTYIDPFSERFTEAGASALKTLRTSLEQGTFAKQLLAQTLEENVDLDWHALSFAAVQHVVKVLTKHGKRNPEYRMGTVKDTHKELEAASAQYDRNGPPSHESQKKMRDICIKINKEMKLIFDELV